MGKRKISRRKVYGSKRMYNDTCSSTSESEMAQASKIVFLFFLYSYKLGIFKQTVWNVTKVYSRGSLYKTLGSFKGTKEILVVDCTFMHFTHTLNIIRKNQHERNFWELCLDRITFLWVQTQISEVLWSCLDIMKLSYFA